VSDQEQLSNRNDWKRTTLGEALPIRYGKARSEKHGLVRKETAVYGSSEIIDTFNRALTNGPTLIIGGKGTVGATHYSADPCWPIDTVYFAEADAEKDLRFFKYLLDHLQLGKMDRSTAVPGLSRDDYNATEVFIPSLDEQREIVAEIEKQFTRLEAGVAGLRRVQANLKRYRAAVLKAACEGKLVPTEAELARQEGRTYETGAQLLDRILIERRQEWEGGRKYKEPTNADVRNLPKLPEGWVWATIEQVSAYIVDCPHTTPSWTTSGRICVRTTDFLPGRLDLTDVRYVNEETYRERVARLQPQGADILYSREGGILGIACQIPSNVTLCMGQRMMLIRAARGIAARLIMHWLNSPFVLSRVKGLTTGSASPHLNVGDVRGFVMPIAPPAEQQRIVSELDRRLSVMEESEAVVNANLQRATRLRQSILQQAFSPPCCSVRTTKGNRTS
jgi:type I restriction enzyme S subunit